MRFFFIGEESSKDVLHCNLAAVCFLSESLFWSQWSSAEAFDHITMSYSRKGCVLIWSGDMIAMGNILLRLQINYSSVDLARDLDAEKLTLEMMIRLAPASF